MPALTEALRVHGAVREASTANTVLVGCLRDVFSSKPHLWRQIAPAYPSWDEFVTQHRQASSSSAVAAPAQGRTQPQPTVRVLAGGLSNLLWVVNEEFVLRVSVRAQASPTAQEPGLPATTAARADDGARSPAAVAGPKGSLDVESAVLWVLAPLSCEVVARGAFQVANPAAEPSAPLPLPGMRGPRREGSGGGGGGGGGQTGQEERGAAATAPAPAMLLQAQYTVLEFVHGFQLPEPAFQAHVHEVAALLAAMHAHLRRKLGALDSLRDAAAGEEADSVRRSVATLRAVQRGHHFVDVVRPWCFLGGRAGSAHLPSYFARWEAIAKPLGFLDPARLRLCHHDAHARNFMVRAPAGDGDGGAADGAAESEGRLRPMVLIDWEFAGMSHPAADLGNTLCETFMDYDDNVFDMPNVGGEAGVCVLQGRVQRCVDAYNAAARRAEGAAAQTVTSLEVWFGICTSHLHWAAWSRSSISAREYRQAVGGTSECSGDGGDGDPDSAAATDEMANFPYEAFARAREQQFRDAAGVVEAAVRRRGDAAGDVGGANSHL